ncbi:MAG: HAD-IA family hydrolase [Hyphomonadaceae bacterium]|nr:HAD-IA family hydrolase [Hyphomonadaceae bacterium]
MPLSRAGQAAIFDLDGVLASTSALHLISWRQAANAFGIEPDEAALAATRSVGRALALQRLLHSAGVQLTEAHKQALMQLKNRRYLELIEALSPADALPGARAALERCRALGLRIGVASASLNAPLVLTRLQFSALIDWVVDPRTLQRPKPDAQAYLAACAALAIPPARAIGLEDSPEAAANLVRAGLYGIGVGAKSAQLAGAGCSECIDTLAHWCVDASVARLRAHALNPD